MLGFIAGSTAAAGTLRVGNGIITTIGGNETWKEASCREDGTDGYHFGDMSKSVWNKFWGSDKPTENVPLATALDTNAEYLSILKNKLMDIQEEIDKYDDDYNEDNIAILTYLKNKKQVIKLEIETFEIKTRQTI